MTGEHDQQIERDPSTFDELNGGRNSEDLPVGLGVGVRTLDVVLQRRFADMDTLPEPPEPPASARERLNARPLSDRRQAARERREANARRKVMHNAGKATLKSVTGPATKAEREEAQRLLDQGVDSMTVARRLNISHRSTRGMLENGS